MTPNWVAFVGMILALSGVEAIANLTGVMRLDQAQPWKSRSRDHCAQCHFFPWRWKLPWAAHC